MPEPVALAGLRTRWLGRVARQLPRCGSTNDEAAAWARQGAPAGALVLAEAQERGRGRLGRSWYSPPGESLYLSVVLRPPLSLEKLPPLTLAAGVAVAEAVAGCGVATELKWPNDVLAGGRKLAGILAETSCVGGRLEHLIMGIGVNLNAARFPPDLERGATSLRLERGGAAVDRNQFTAELCLRLEAWHDRFVAHGAAEVARAWRAHARSFGRSLTVISGSQTVSGVAEALTDEGALLLRADDGSVVTVNAGEIVG